MNIFCRLLGHTWLHKTEDPKMSWNTSKNLSELDLTVEGEPRFWLQCERCGERNENPTREDLKRAM